MANLSVELAEPLEDASTPVVVVTAGARAVAPELSFSVLADDGDLAAWRARLGMMRGRFARSAIKSVSRVSSYVLKEGFDHSKKPRMFQKDVAVRIPKFGSKSAAVEPELESISESCVVMTKFKVSNRTSLGVLVFCATSSVVLLSGVLYSHLQGTHCTHCSYFFYCHLSLSVDSPVSQLYVPYSLLYPPRHLA
jgi:hypothetical protein